MPLSELTVRKLQAPARGRRELYDGIIPGFGVRVTDKGAKSYIFVYAKNGNRHRYTIGPVGAFALTEAREKARELYSQVKDGRDPCAEKRAPKATPALFKDVVALFERRALAGKRTGRETMRIIQRDLLPHWKDKPFGSITTDDVHDRIDAVLDNGRNEAARRLFEITRRIFNWARAQRDSYRVERSPCEGLKSNDLFGAKPFRDRTLKDAELRAIWNAANEIGRPFGPIVRLLVLTGLRRNEVACARWAEFDLDSAIWTIPPERMKAAAAHVVPLTAEMLEIILALPRDGQFLFSGSRGSNRPVSGFSPMKARLDGRLSGVADWTLHDIRRTVRTHLSSLPVPELVRELVIAHTKPGLHRVYDQHAYLDEKRRALELWAARLKTIIEPQAGGNVVALRAS
jgi:integrase